MRTDGWTVLPGPEIQYKEKLSNIKKLKICTLKRYINIYSRNK